MNRTAPALLFLLILLLLSSIGLSDEGGLPDDCARLFEAAYPGYAVIASDGRGGDAFAAVLHKAGDNVLVIAEQREDGYAFVLNNPNAVPDEGHALYAAPNDVSVDIQAGDRPAKLTLTMTNRDSEWVITSERSADGGWRNVQSEYTDKRGQENLVYWSHVFYADQSYNLMRHTEQKDGKPLRTATYPRVPVQGGTLQMAMLNTFDAARYPYTPDHVPTDCLSDYAAPHVPQGCTLRQLCVKPTQLMLLLDDAQGNRFLRILPHENNTLLTARESAFLPRNASMDLFHMDDDSLLLTWHDSAETKFASFVMMEQGEWRLESFSTGSAHLRFTHDSVSAMPAIARNDDVFYGRHPWQLLSALNFFSLPETLDDAVARLDQSVYAFVRNPNPADRLHLRERPRKDARSLGKFYNRTPVRVHSIDGEWAHVSITPAMSGYMMVEYLAFGPDMRGVDCAFPQMELREESKPLALRQAPGGKKMPVFVSGLGEYFIVGVSGEEWYILLTPDGSAGYAPQSAFWPGNG